MWWRVTILLCLIVSCSRCGQRTPPTAPAELNEDRAGGAAFRLENRTSAPLYFDFQYRMFRLEGRAGDSFTQIPVDTHCRQPYRRGGRCLRAGVDFMCGQPAIRTLAVPAGASYEVQWDGVTYPGSSSCPSGYEERFASAGEYRVEFCASPGLSAPRDPPREAQELFDAMPTGAPTCIAAVFSLPSAEPVPIVFSPASASDG